MMERNDDYNSMLILGAITKALHNGTVHLSEEKKLLTSELEILDELAKSKGVTII